MKVERVETTVLEGSGLNWESGIGTKAEDRALEGVGTLWERRYVTVGHG